MSFQSWLEQADIPVKVDGVWVDLETGIPYSGFTAKPVYVPSNNTVDARAYAKQFGGKALTGTAKQKEWAETIRKGKLMLMTVEHAELACKPTSLGRFAKFWIDNRFASADDIAEFFELCAGYLAAAKAHKAAERHAEYAQVAERYNELTSRWGFQ